MASETGERVVVEIDVMTCRNPLAQWRGAVIPCPCGERLELTSAGPFDRPENKAAIASGTGALLVLLRDQSLEIEHGCGRTLVVVRRQRLVVAPGAGACGLPPLGGSDGGQPSTEKAP